MKYSEELIKEVRELFPNYIEMHKHAEEGNVVLGRYLSDCSDGTIYARKLLDATSLEDVKALANMELRKVALYKKWGIEYDAFRKTTP